MSKKVSSPLAKVIAIDGPSGSGKSSVAQELSHKLGITYVNTGAMYRALGLMLDRQGIDLEDELKVGKALKKLKMTYHPDFPKNPSLISINGEDLTQAITEHKISSMASKVSKLSVVRDYLLDVQRDLAQNHFCIMEGRDIGTVVFPDAFVKVYLTAEERVRAGRRLHQLEENGERGQTLEGVLKDVLERDKRDIEREHAPLRVATDALILDSTEITLTEVVEKIAGLAKNRAFELGVPL